MRSRVSLVFAVLFGHAHSAALPTASRKDDLIASPSRFWVPGYVSASLTNTSSSHIVPDGNVFALSNASQRPSNYSTPNYDLPFDYSLSVFTTSAPQCNGTTYGTNLDRYSCFDAWRYIGLTPQRVSWGPRGPGLIFHGKLPHRWSSGRSAIAIGT